jgi:hypothetical protein
VIAGILPLRRSGRVHGQRGFLAEERAMRWMSVIFLLVVLFLVDHYRFRGYYAGQLSGTVERTIRSVGR